MWRSPAEWHASWSEAVTELLQTISRRGQAKLADETEAERRSRQGWIMGQLTTARNRLAIAQGPQHDSLRRKRARTGRKGLGLLVFSRTRQHAAQALWLEGRSHHRRSASE